MRKLSDQAKQNKAAYDTVYMREKVEQITIGFVKSNPEDQKLKAWICKQPNKTRYIKELVKDDMEKNS